MRGRIWMGNILILLNKDKVELDDHDYISYPFFELGWTIDVQIHPILYTFKDWMERSFSSFYKNVEREGVIYVKCRRRNSSAY